MPRQASDQIIMFLSGFVDFNDVFVDYDRRWAQIQEGRPFSNRRGRAGDKEQPPSIGASDRGNSGG